MDDQSHINGTLPSEPTDKADAGNHGNKELTAEEEKEETGCEKKRTKQPFMYCSLIVRRPKLMFGKFYFSKSLYCHPTPVWYSVNPCLYNQGQFYGLHTSIFFIMFISLKYLKAIKMHVNPVL